MKIKYIPLISLFFVGGASAFVTYEEQPAPKPYVAPASSYTSPSGGFAAQQKNSINKDVSGLACKNGIMSIGAEFESEIINSRGTGNFLSATKQIAPKGWRIVEKSQPKIKRKAYQIGWEEEGQWQDILAKVAEKANGCAFVNWDMKSIIISMNEEAPAFDRADKLNADRLSGQSPIKPVTPIIPASTTPSILAPYKDPEANNLLLTNRHWALEPGKTLRVNLMEWGKKAGWSVLWKVENVDFNVTHRAVITGTFMEAIEIAMKAYKDSKNPIAADSYEEGRVIEIVNYTPFKRNTTDHQ